MSNVKRGAPVEILQKVPLFVDLSEKEIQQIARLFKVRRFDEGETVVKEGTGGAAFYIIDSGEATVFIAGKRLSTLAAGEYFGEIALIDEGTRMAGKVSGVVMTSLPSAGQVPTARIAGHWYRN